MMSTKKNVADIYPLTPMQQGMLFHSVYAPGSGVYVQQVSCTLQGELNVPAFKTAWQKTIDRHAILRTAFVWEGVKQPVQVVGKQVKLPFKYYDWQERSPKAQEEALTAFLEEDRQTGFQLSHAPLMRLTLIQLTHNTYHLTWSHHHILLDGWCLGIILKEVFGFYQAGLMKRPLRLPTPRPFRDYIAWLQQQDMTQARQYWQTQLKGLDNPTPLLMGHQSQQPPRYDNETTDIPAPLTEALQTFARQNQLTLNTIIQGVWGLLLSRYSGQTDVLFGTVVSGRPPELKGADKMLGLFINTLPQRLHIPRQTAVQDWLQTIQTQQSEMRQFEYTPLVDIQAWSHIPSDQPLFESLLVFENYPTGSELSGADHVLTIDNIHVSETTNYPLSIVVSPGQTIFFRILYDVNRFSCQTIQRILSHFHTALANLLKAPQQPLQQWQMLPLHEQNTLLYHWNETAVSYPPHPIHYRFQEQAAHHPQQIALSHQDQTLTYQQLNHKANQLAHLLQEKGITHGDRVGLFMGRSLDSIITILAILKANATYVPLDPAYPQDRLQFMITDTNLPLIVTHAHLAPALPPQTTPIIRVDTLSLDNYSTDNLPVTATIDDIAYINYTSGSTGRPKGVQIPHRGVLRLLSNVTYITLDTQQTFLHLSPITFDASTLEIWGALLHGGRCVLLAQTIPTTTALGQVIQKQGITSLWLTASLFNRVIDEDPSILSPVQQLFTGGEALSVSHVRRALATLPTLCLNNGYGPTESTTFTTTYAIPRSLPDDTTSIPIGHPIANTQVYVLNDQQEISPIGVPGELCIGGHGLAQDYLHRPRLTAEKFIPHPYSDQPGARLYRTGDLVRYLPDGRLEFLGRIDHQVKLRGFRIELGEIETTLAQHPQVAQTTLLLREEKGEKQLIAYFVPSDHNAPTTSELRHFLSQTLPDYMLPALFIPLTHMPLTPNGKVDRRALPAPNADRPDLQQAYVAPRTPTEEMLANIWLDVLQLEKVGVHDNFFELGGHSLLITQLASRIRKAFNTDLSLAQLFETATIAEMAPAIDQQHQVSQGVEVPAIEPIDRTQPLPLSFAQQRLWFLDQLQPNQAFYNVPLALKFIGPLDQHILQASLDHVVARHEILRTQFVTINGEAYQQVLPERTITIEQVALHPLPADEREEAARQQLIQAAQRPFNLTHDPLLRVTLYQLEPDHTIGLFVMHHIISDGWSIGILVREISASYAALTADATPDLPPLPIQYADFAHWQRSWLTGDVLEAQLDYWRNQLGTNPPLLDMPTDYPYPPMQSYAGATMPITLPAALTRQLHTLSQKADATLFMTLMAALQVLLHRYTRQDDILVGFPIANRNRLDIESLIGFFVNTLVLRGDLSPRPSFLRFLHQIRQTTLDAYAHQDLPFEKLVNELEPDRDLSRPPLFQLFFALQNAPIEGQAVPGLRLEPLPISSQTAKFEITIELSETADGLSGFVEYNSDLFHPNTIERFIQHFQHLLHSIVQDPKQAVDQLPILPQAAQTALLPPLPQTYPATPCLHTRFEQQAAQTPHATALTFEGQTMTYATLNQRANQVAHYLQEMHSLQAGDRVGLLVNRSIDMIVGILAILKAGGGYVPLDPHVPAERLAFIMTDADLTAVLTQQAYQSLISPDTPTLLLDDPAQPYTQYPTTNPALITSPDQLAYVIYTSGSTGQPKGALIPHKNVARLFTATDDWFHFNQADVWTLFHSYAFDFSVWEIWGALLYGGRLVIVPYHISRDPTRFYQLLADEQVTILNQTPSAFQQLMAVDSQQYQETSLALRTIIFGGEALDIPGLKPWFQRHGDTTPQLINMYGITETTVHVTYQPIRAYHTEKPASIIGEPIPDLQLYILDPHLNPVPVGIPGELHVGGAGLAIGYLNRAKLTAQRFIQHPYLPGERLYKTGDLARFLPDGNIEYMGRIDNQVKIRGFRIELGEIEAVLRQQSGITNAIVIAKAGPQGDQLAAYLIGTADVQTLRHALAQKLPDYMIPAFFVFMERFPLTPNGKLDVRALPEPQTSRAVDSTYEPPQTPVEQQLVQIWAGVLGLEEIGRHDNFFSLGGDSILSIQIVARANEQGLGLTPRHLFQHPTIAQLASMVQPGRPIEAEQGPVQGEVPLTPIQHWFWDLNLDNPNHWNQSLFLSVNTPLDPTILAQAVHALSHHHDMLRWQWQGDTGIITLPTDTIPFNHIDLSHVAANEQNKALTTHAQQQQTSLSLADGPLWRVCLFDVGPHQPQQLLIVIHHLVIDGVSWRILLEDLQKAYTQLSQDQAVQLPRKTTSFKRWAEKLATYHPHQERDYWLNAIPADIPELPQDMGDGENRETFARQESISLTRTETQHLLQTLPTQNHVQINDVLLTALAHTISQWTGHPHVLIDLEGHGREEIFPDVDLSRTVGWFTSIYPVAFTVNGSWEDQLKHAKTQYRRVPHNGLGYGLLRHHLPELDALPQSQISFNYLGQFDQVLNQASIFAQSQAAPGSERDAQGQRPYLFDVSGFIAGEQLHLNWAYSHQIYQQATIQQLLETFAQAVRDIIAYALPHTRPFYTPTDFPLAPTLQSDELMQLESHYPALNDIYALTPTQAGIFFHSLYDPSPGVYCVQLAFTLNGQLDPTAFGKAWELVVNRHPILQTAFVIEGLSEPLQVVQANVRPNWTFYDWQEESSTADKFAQLVTDDLAQGFALDQPPLVRFTMVQTAVNQYRCIWNSHHLVLDGWSLPLVLADLFTAYQAILTQTPPTWPPTRPFRDYITWLQDQDLAAARAFWQETLAEFSAPTPLIHPPAQAERAPQPGTYQKHVVSLDEAITTALQTLAQQHKLTINTVMQGAWALLLSQYSREQHIVFGVTVSGRPPELIGADNIVGMFINTLPLHTSIHPTMPLSPWLHTIQQQQVDARQYEYTPLTDIQNWSQVPAGTPLFESLLIFENYPIDNTVVQQSDGIRIADLDYLDLTNYPLVLEVVPQASLTLRLVYDHHRFDHATIHRLTHHLVNLLTQFTHRPQAPLAAFSLLDITERQQLLYDWNQSHLPLTTTWAEADTQTTPIHHFQRQAHHTPHAIAVSHQHHFRTYQQLNTDAAHLAYHLQQLGIGHESLVPLLAHRGIDFLTAVLALFKLGAAYLPLDPTHPPHRYAQILRQIHTPHLLVADDLASHLAPINTLLDQPPALHSLNALLAQSPPPSPPTFPPVPPRTLAYTIFTSGSTGLPKGAMVETEGMLNHIFAKIHDLQLTADDIVAQNASQCFDISVWQFITPLLIGGQVRIYSDDIAHDPHQLLAQVAHNRVTILETVPSLMRAMIEDLDTNPQPPDLSSLRWLIPTGEALPPALARRWLTHFPHLPLLNAYGPTECSDDVTHYAISQPPHPALVNMPIGTPVANMTLFILDHYLQPVPVGVPGQLFVGGIGVGRGYINAPHKTAAVFIPHPFSHHPGSRLYQTGDLARFLPDGNIEFLGRIDFQVKIRGFRIELGEIEAVLTRHEAIREAVALTRDDARGVPQLVAYLVETDDTDTDTAVYRAYLQDRLPHYMVPAAFVILPHMPLNRNGKIDRNALPHPDFSQTQTPFVAPQTPIQHTLAHIWQEVLHLDKVGIHDDFLDLGGHSLVATRIASRVRTTFQLELPPQRLFEYPTIAELARYIDEQSETAVVKPPLTLLPRSDKTLADLLHEIKPGATIDRLSADLTEPQQSRLNHTLARKGSQYNLFPLSFAQQRLWFLDQLDPNSTHYNIPLVLRLVGQLDISRLNEAINQIIQRHDILRTTFHLILNKLYQHISPPYPFTIPVVDLSAEPNPGELATQEAVTTINTPLDLQTGPLFRLKLLRLHSDEYVLVFVIHHIISDGWSTGVFINELSQLYATSHPLPPLPIQYGDFAVWQRSWLQGEVLDQQLDYWQEQMADAPPLLELPTDFPRPHLQTYHGASHSFALSADHSQSWHALCQKEGVTLFVGLLAIFKLLLYRYSKQDDICVGTPMAGRQDEALEPLIGFFVNTVVLRTQFSEQDSFRTLLQRIRQVVLDGYGHQDLPFEKLVDALQVERSLSYSPLFQVLFALQNIPTTHQPVPELQLKPFEVETQTAQFDLSLMMLDEGEQISGTFVYNTALFTADTISRMARHWQQLLTAVLATPDAPISQLTMLSPEEVAAMTQWNETAVSLSLSHPLLTHPMETIAQQQPHTTALIFNEAAFSYQALNQQANQLAHYLQTQGIGPETLVAVCLERTPRLLVAILAVLKTGAAYVPIDPHYPPERINFMMIDAQTSLLLTQADLPVTLSSYAPATLFVDADWDALIATQPTNNLSVTAHPDNLAYLIYTSGSTGTPKGVAITHGNARAMVAWATSIFPPDTLTGVLTGTSVCFDLSIFEIFLTLSSGGTLILAENMLALPTLPARDQVTLINTVPSALSALLTGGKLPPHVRIVNLAGEPLHRALVNQIYEHPQVEAVYNLYGPSEDTTYSTFTLVPAHSEAAPTIGAPIHNTQVFILDNWLQQVPPGLPGELYLSGLDVARGYWQRPSTTADRFIPHPFSTQAGDRLYRTGDLARFLPDGQLVFMGRVDNQVKFRGFRIELGEIEAVLSNLDGVQETAVLLHQDQPDNPQLVAYAATNLAHNHLQQHLQEQLPAHMIPTFIFTLPHIPHLPNGKIDRKALPAPERPDLATAYVAPRTDQERELAAILKEILHIEQIGIEDDFFALGGHSLLAVQYVNQVNQQFQASLPVRVIFEQPTIAGLSQHLTDHLAALENAEAAAPATLVPVPLTPGQHSFFSQGHPHPHHVNITRLIEVPFQLNSRLMKQTLHHLSQRHDIFGRRFFQDDTDWQQIGGHDRTIPLHVHNFSRQPEAAQEQAFQETAAAHQQSLHLTDGPLCIAAIFNFGHHKANRLLVIIHPLLADQISVDILLEELQLVYAQLVQGQAAQLPPPTTSFSDEARAN